MSESKSIQRTKQAIESAFFDLLKTKSFADITLTEIIEKSGYSRSTFYKHYTDKYDFADKLIRNCAERFAFSIGESVKANEPANDEDSAYKMLYGIYKYVEENRRFFSAVIKEKIPHYSILNVADILSELLQKIIRIDDQDMNKNINSDFFFYMIAHETMVTIRYWDSCDFLQGTDDITKLALASYKQLGYFTLGIQQE